MDQLLIDKQIEGNLVVLCCSGRLDANRASYLNDSIDRLVREGHYVVALDLEQVDYLSSAGIRTLVNQYKNLKAVNGQLYLKSASANVAQVLEMVGLYSMLSEAPASIVPDHDTSSASQQIDVYSGMSFSVTPLLHEAEMQVQIYGNPGLLAGSAFSEGEARVHKAEGNKFAIGLGAIGGSYNECAQRFGEYMMLGKNIAYLPADGSRKPDYLSGSGQLVAALTELYGIHFSGSFSHLIRFEPAETGATIGLSTLVEKIAGLTGFDRFALVLAVESGGLIGTSLNVSPVGGTPIFSFPEVRHAVNFTTEPAYNKMLTLAAGYLGQSNDLNGFLRELSSGSKLWGHVHAAVFPYMPMKKREIDLTETINTLFDQSELIDLMHLTNDSREINGLGESRFVQGFCWIAPVKHIDKNQTKN